MKFGLSPIFCVALASVALFASPSRAAILVDQTSHSSNFVGGGDWSGAFTSALANQPGGYFFGSINNAADVAAATAEFWSFIEIRSAQKHFNHPEPLI